MLNGTTVLNGTSTGATITGATTADITISGIQVANAGNYSVKVRDNQPDSSTSSNLAIILPICVPHKVV